MNVLRIALGQVNPTVGDLEGNARLIRQAAADAAAGQADLLILPEMVLTGYPVEDLSLRPSFQQASRLAMSALARDIADDGFGDLVCLIGYLDHSDDDDDADAVGRPRGGPVNSAALVHRGAALARYDKHFLPNYGVFDEARYFVPGESPLVFEMNGHRVCVAICEDLWRHGGPVQWAREFDADLLAVLNASPYERMKDDRRLELCVEQAQASGSAVAYTNMTGGQDELVFDGDSLVVDAAGQLLQRACQFDSQIVLADLTATRVTSSSRDDVHVSIPASSTSARERAPLTPAHTLRFDDSAELYAALRLGLADYVNKNGFTSVLLGLSGGIDSAFVAALAVDALGADRVFGVAMPSRYSSSHSVQDAYDLAERTGLTLRDVPIGPMFDAFQSSLHLTGLAEENLQARIRGMVLMSLSNAEGHLVLATGNKSELSVGYSTIYGDAVGGFAPIKDVPKTLVWELARWRNEQAESAGSTGPIPPRSITKEPSAELSPDQKDSDSLPDYQDLDSVLEAYVDDDTGASELVAAGFDAALVERIVRLTDGAEYKRRQYPPGTKIGVRAFGRDRRLPITNRWRERPELDS
ncbi:MAG: NAD+ synthase [Candidatus Nanopelagicales bacterium]|nr:NAD+ synthase [Candidatus Nanopelagicales bacterium]